MLYFILTTLLYYLFWLLIGLVIYDAYRAITDPCKLPGPYGAPLLGYLPFLGKRSYLTFTELGKKYGPIFQIRMGFSKVIILNDLEAIKEAFGQHEFADRPKLPSLQLFVDKVGPIASLGFNQNSPVMQYTRKLSIRSIGTMVNSKDSRLDQLSADAVQYNLTNLKNGTQDSGEVIKMSVGMVIGSLSFGHVFDSTSKALPIIFSLTDQVGDFISVGKLSDFIPVLGSIFHKQADKFCALLTVFNDYVNDRIDEHNLNSNSEICDIQDAIEYMYGSTREELLGKLNVSLNEVKHVGQALFGAGFSTASEHYHMALILLATFPDIQEKVFEDIKAVMGDEEIRDEVSLDNRSRMPYTQAFLTELFRFFSHVPLSLPHATSEATVFRGYSIPKGTMVMSNLWSVHHDKEMFGPDVHTFNPHRFLDENTLDERMRHVIPFGVGRRKCVGELLARRELFLLIAKTVQKAEVKLISFDGIDPSDTVPGFTLLTRSSKVQLIIR